MMHRSTDPYAARNAPHAHHPLQSIDPSTHPFPRMNERMKEPSHFFETALWRGGGRSGHGGGAHLQQRWSVDGGREHAHFQQRRSVRGGGRGGCRDASSRDASSRDADAAATARRQCCRCHRCSCSCSCCCSWRLRRRGGGGLERLPGRRRVGRRRLLLGFALPRLRGPAEALPEPLSRRQTTDQPNRPPDRPTARTARPTDRPTLPPPDFWCFFVCAPVQQPSQHLAINSHRF